MEEDGAVGTELVTRLELKAFLERNPYTWDTARGFAAKLGRSVALVATALADLEHLGLVLARRTGGNTVYQYRDEPASS